MPSSESVCRVCLSSDVRMHSIEDFQLAELYEKLVSAKLNTEDGMPHTICYICVGQLQRWQRFSDTARRSEKFLKDLLVNDLKVTKETVATLNIGVTRSLSVTNLKAVSLNGYSIDGSTSIVLEAAVKIEIAEVEFTKTESNSSKEVDIKKETDANSNKSIFYNCDKCRVKFKTEKLLSTHLNIHYEKTYCNKCNKLFSCNSAFKSHMSIHTGEKPYACHICSRTFRRKVYLEGHIRVHKEKPYFCKNCNAGFAQADNLKKHMLLHLKDKQYTCNQCSKRFPFKSHLIRHIHVHTGEKSFPCSSCDKKFSDAGNLKVHMRIHNGEKPYACDMCQRKFTFYTAFAKHIQMHKKPINIKKKTMKTITGTQSVKNNKLACEICDKKVKSRCYLIRHMLVHNEERPFPCNECTKSFKSKQNLKEHKKTHSGEKNCSCEICGKSFTMTGSLNKHMVVHTGALPYACHLCDKAYKQSGQLTDHIRNFHNGIKRFSCDLCGQRFTASSHLKRHMNSHAGIKPYSCLKCLYKFATGTSLKRHMKTCNK